MNKYIKPVLIITLSTALYAMDRESPFVETITLPNSPVLQSEFNKKLKALELRMQALSNTMSEHTKSINNLDLKQQVDSLRRTLTLDLCREGTYLFLSIAAAGLMLYLILRQLPHATLPALEHSDEKPTPK